MKKIYDFSMFCDTMLQKEMSWIGMTDIDYGQPEYGRWERNIVLENRSMSDAGECYGN